MQKHYTAHSVKGARTLAERCCLDPELGHKKGCCHHWHQDPAAPRAHGPCRPSPQSHWQQAYYSHRGCGSGWYRGPKAPVLQQQKQRQPQPPTPSPTWQRLNLVHRAQKGPPETACGSFTSYGSDILTEDDVYCSCLAKTLCHVPVPVTVGFYAPFGCRLHMMLDKITRLLMAVYSVGKHLFVSQRKKIERLVSHEKFGSQLGFMCEVKKEVELLTDFLCFLEIYQRRRLRVVLEVTGLDTCYPERVVGVLNAINTLLSDSHAPFIFILVVDPSILAACLESAGNMKGTADNGYLFLNRTVTLPFSVPIMGRRTKLQFLHDAVQSRDDLLFLDRQQAGGAPEARARLWDVFCDNSRELHSMTKALQNVLDLDGDPELFERFLGSDFPFTVAEAQSLLRCTVNLDHSIRRRMGLIRAVSALRPPSPPKSPARDAPSAAGGATNTAGASPGGSGAGHTSGTHHPLDKAHVGKPKPKA
ncbi:NTPase KAP family P-loop domain-containing protein 1 [Fukomys damarensis]|uniref:NTPase KAP family P-loop domain-containing protein 1 n=1 Tax=Fukomys damarensis TaxID=885580 RepID=UPI0014557F6C|nr:NTPase KAP family P-loop domain-containing protein 1 [Fukomys damarensis]